MKKRLATTIPALIFSAILAIISLSPTNRSLANQAVPVKVTLTPEGSQRGHYFPPDLLKDAGQRIQVDICFFFYFDGTLAIDNTNNEHYDGILSTNIKGQALTDCVTAIKTRLTSKNTNQIAKAFTAQETQTAEKVHHAQGTSSSSDTGSTFTGYERAEIATLAQLYWNKTHQGQVSLKDPLSTSDSCANIDPALCDVGIDSSFDKSTTDGDPYSYFNVNYFNSYYGILPNAQLDIDITNVFRNTTPLSS